MKNKHSVISIIFLTTIVFIFFQKFFLKGQIPIPSDIPTGMYYPWINQNFGYPVRVPVKNSIITDSISQFWIWRNWAINSLKQNQLPFWNPFSLGGYSMSSWFHTILFSPANIFYLFLNTTNSMALIVIIQLAISLISTYFLIKKITSSNLAGLFGSISFSFSSFFIGWLTWGTISWSLAFLPLIILFSHSIIYQKINLKNIFGLYISTILSFLGGHPQTFFYILIVVGLYYLSYFLLNLKSIKKLILPAVIFFFCFLSTTFITIPSLKILQNSIRQTENYISQNGSGFIPFGKLVITLFAPDFYGNPVTNNYWGGDFNYQEKLVWFGTSALILVIFYFIYFKKTKQKLDHLHLFLFSCFILGLLLTVKYPIGFLVYKFHLPLISTSSAGRSIILSIFSGSIIASLAIKKIITSTDPKTSISARITTLFNLIFFGSIFLSIITIKKLLHQNIDPQYLQNLNVAIRNLIIPFTITLSTSVILLISTKSRKYQKIFLAGFIIIALCEGIRYGWKYTPFTNPTLFFPITPTTQFLTSQYQLSNEPFRIEREKSELMPPNMWQVYQFYSLSGYDPIAPKNFSNFLSQEHIIQDHTRYIEYETKYLDQISNYGIKYFLTLKRDKNNNIDSNGSISKDISLKKWKPVFQEGPVVILENIKFTPLYYLNSPKGSEISLTKHNSNYWEFKVKTNTNNKLFLLENTDQNWQVTVNDKPQSILSYNGTFKSVEINSGESIVKFYYYDKIFFKYLIISGSSLIIGTILAIYYSKKQNRS